MKKRMRILPFVLVVMLCLSLFVGCGKRQPKPEEGVEASNATSYETTTSTDSDTIAAGLVRLDDASKSRKYAQYVPKWA